MKNSLGHFKSKVSRRHFQIRKSDVIRVAFAEIATVISNSILLALRLFADGRYVIALDKHVKLADLPIARLQSIHDLT